MLVEAARRDGQRAVEVAPQLAGALADPDPSGGRVAARAHDQQIAVLAADHSVQRAGNREVGLNDDPRVRRELITNLCEGRSRLPLEALPIEALGE